MRLQRRLFLLAVLFFLIVLFISVHFIRLPDPGPKEPSEKVHNKRVDVLQLVRTGMHHEMVRFLQRTATITSSSRDTHTTSSTYSTSHKSSYTKNLTSPSDIWKMWGGWVKPDVFYAPDDFWSSEMTTLIYVLATTPITLLDLGHRGTQLKATMYLQGEQRTVFKPKRYQRDAVVGTSDDPYAGYDRHNGEIAAFHLDGILGFHLAPPVVGRKINLTQLRPLTSEKLLKTYLMKDGNVCFYGKCMYCKPSEAACADGDVMEGSVTIWLPDWYTLRTWRHPYQRTYIPGRKARWEYDQRYCQQELLQPSSKYYYLMLDVTDTTVFDFLTGNADRHHFETYTVTGDRARLIHLDNGKSFGNPDYDEMSILSPLRQCCRLRNSTWSVLLSLRHQPLSHLLDSSLRRDPLYPILTQPHLAAIDRRHSILIREVEDCIRQYGADTVLVSTWN